MVTSSDLKKPTDDTAHRRQHDDTTQSQKQEQALAWKKLYRDLQRGRPLPR